MMSLDQVLASDRSLLVQQWLSLFHRPPPANTQVALMRRILAWHAQAQARTRGLKRARGVVHGAAMAPLSPVPATTPAVEPGMKPVMARSGPVLKPRQPFRALKPGTRLLREWKGATHEVLVLPEGFEYAGSSFGSLTAIAKTITGTQWSGPQFFGVKP